MIMLWRGEKSLELAMNATPKGLNEPKQIGTFPFLIKKIYQFWVMRMHLHLEGLVGSHQMRKCSRKEESSSDVDHVKNHLR